MCAGPVYGYRSVCGYRSVRGELVGVYVCWACESESVCLWGYRSVWGVVGVCVVCVWLGYAALTTSHLSVAFFTLQEFSAHFMKVDRVSTLHIHLGPQANGGSILA